MQLKFALRRLLFLLDRMNCTRRSGLTIRVWCVGSANTEEPDDHSRDPFLMENPVARLGHWHFHDEHV